MRFTAHICLIASAAVLAASVARAEPDAKTDPSPPDPKAQAAKAEAGSPKADVATLLFGNPQWGKAPVGSTLTYAYSKKTDKAVYGNAFDDKIVLKLDAGNDADSRTSEVKLFSGANARPAGPFRDDKQNPVMLIVLEENVQELSKLFKANPRYLKNAIRKAWREKAKIEPVDVDVDGKQVPGTRITIAPFVGDAETAKMQGLDGMTYTVEIADSVPGNIASVDIRAPADGKALFSETLKYQGETK